MGPSYYPMYGNDTWTEDRYLYSPKNRKNRDWNRRGRTWRNVSPLERRERERGMVRNVRGAVVEAYKGKEKKKKKKKLGGGREEWWKKA